VFFSFLFSSLKFINDWSYVSFSSFEDRRLPTNTNRDLVMPASISTLGISFFKLFVKLSWPPMLSLKCASHSTASEQR